MSVRVWNRDEDYKMLETWWIGHAGWSPIPCDDLPDTGYIANDTAFGCLYIDIHCRFAMMEWIVSRPDASGKLLVKSLNEVIERLLLTAKELGVKRVYSVLKHEGLIKLYQKHGFNQGDTSVCDMIWIGE